MGELTKAARLIREAETSARAAALALADEHRESVAIKLHRITNELGALRRELVDGS